MSTGSDREPFHFVILTRLPCLLNVCFACRLSKLHKDRPWGMDVHGQRYEVGYWPGDSKSGMFGGNSNWRGPICEYLRSYMPLHSA